MPRKAYPHIYGTKPASWVHLIKLGYEGQAHPLQDGLALAHLFAGVNLDKIIKPELPREVRPRESPATTILLHSHEGVIGELLCQGGWHRGLPNSILLL